MPASIEAFVQSNIVTPRLTLGSLEMSDAPRIEELAGNLNVSKTTRNIPYPYEEGMAEAWIKSMQVNALTTESITYAIQLSDEDLLIGLIGINAAEAEIGFLDW